MYKRYFSTFSLLMLLVTNNLHTATTETDHFITAGKHRVYNLLNEMPNDQKLLETLEEVFIKDEFRTYAFPPCRDEFSGDDDTQFAAFVATVRLGFNIGIHHALTKASDMVDSKLPEAQPVDHKARLSLMLGAVMFRDLFSSTLPASKDKYEREAARCSAQTSAPLQQPLCLRPLGVDTRSRDIAQGVLEASVSVEESLNDLIKRLENPDELILGPSNASVPSAAAAASAHA